MSSTFKILLFSLLLIGCASSQETYKKLESQLVSYQLELRQQEPGQEADISSLQAEIETARRNLVVFLCDRAWSDPESMTPEMFTYALDELEIEMARVRMELGHEVSQMDGYPRLMALFNYRHMLKVARSFVQALP
ncbi:MAG: hypothetical protein H6619_02665 [Deltaproteobacteria bacterium]|nr:hypothetical protein [Deltaproteobacteria bacterium]